MCLFAIVAGANWVTFDRYGSDMPDWDQWDGEAVHLLSPWFAHDHFIANLFQPHNEHRIIVTKLQNLAVVNATGQWDVRVECFFNTLLHGAIAVLLWETGRRSIARRWHPVYFALVAAMYALPLAWQNLLGGFHSQQYWLILFSFGAVATLPFAAMGTARWWLGAITAILALGTMGSGFLAAVVVGGMLGWRWLEHRTTLRQIWPTMVLMIALIAIGALTRVEVPYHEQLKAKSVHDFMFSLLRSFEWPVQYHDWAGVILWAPWFIVVLRAAARLRSGDRAQNQTSATELIVIGLGAWVLIQLLATAYARGAGAEYPASRYMDTLMFATVINGLALVWLLGGRSKIQGAAPSAPQPMSERASSATKVDSSNGRALRVLAWLLALAWLGTLIVGLAGLWDRNVNHELPDTRKYYWQTEDHLRAYLATNNPGALVGKIPYPDAASLVERLSHPFIRELMPSSVRPALPVASAAPDSDFVGNGPRAIARDDGHPTGTSPQTPILVGRPTWGSYNTKGTTNTGEWRSAPMAPPRFGRLRFEVAGDVGEPGISLELHDAATDRLLARVRASKVPGDEWRSAYVKAPRKSFVIVAKDEDSKRWLAFSAPSEMSAVSYWAWQLMKNGLVIAAVAASIAVVLFLLSPSRRRNGFISDPQ